MQRAACLPIGFVVAVVGEIVADPLVDPVQRHCFILCGQNGSPDHTGIAAGRLEVLVSI